MSNTYYLVNGKLVGNLDDLPHNTTVAVRMITAESRTHALRMVGTIEIPTDDENFTPIEVTRTSTGILIEDDHNILSVAPDQIEDLIDALTTLKGE